MRLGDQLLQAEDRNKTEAFSGSMETVPAKLVTCSFTEAIAFQNTYRRPGTGHGAMVLSKDPSPVRLNYRRNSVCFPCSPHIGSHVQSHLSFLLLPSFPVFLPNTQGCTHIQMSMCLHTEEWIDSVWK